MLKRLPNCISCLRIVLSLWLLFLTDKPLLFALVYVICGVSDVMDGYLARELNAQTKLGSKLDSVGDFVFFMVYLWVLVIFVNQGSGIITGIIIIALLRVINLVITKVKFKQWGVMHTVGNKITGLMLFLMLPVWVFAPEAICLSLTVVGVLAGLSALEEGLILLKSETYDADRKSIITKRK